MVSISSISLMSVSCQCGLPVQAANNREMVKPRIKKAVKVALGSYNSFDSQNRGVIDQQLITMQSIDYYLRVMGQKEATQGILLRREVVKQFYRHFF